MNSHQLAPSAVIAGRLFVYGSLLAFSLGFWYGVYRLVTFLL